MTTATTAAQWITALDGDQLRHYVTRDIDMTFVAACGAQFWQQDERPVIPRRCLACLHQLGGHQPDVLPTISETDPFPCCRQSPQHDARPDASR